MKGKIICTDLDGTLFYPKDTKRMLSKENIDFLRRFIDDGGEVLLVSSRNIGIKKRIEEVLERPLNMVGCNGGFVNADDKFIYQKFFNNEHLKACLDYLDETANKKICMLSTTADAFITKDNWLSSLMKYYFKAQGVLKESYIHDDEVYEKEVSEGNVYKVMELMGVFARGAVRARKIVPHLEEKFPDIEFAYSGKMLEFNPKGATKSQGIAFYLDYRGISHDNVWVVGDSGNDVTMFKMFPERSFCMKHAPKHVRAHAKYLVKSVSDLQKQLYPSEDSKPSVKEK